MYSFYGHKQIGFKQFLLVTFCMPSFKGLLNLSLWDIDTPPQVTIYSYIAHILDNPTSQVDSTCSSFYINPGMSPVRFGTLILMHNPIASVDKPIWIWACLIYISLLIHSHLTFWCYFSDIICWLNYLPNPMICLTELPNASSPGPQHFSISEFSSSPSFRFSVLIKIKKSEEKKL